MIEIDKTLPKGWEWTRLGEHVIKIGSGVTPSGGQAVYQQTGIPLIRSQNVHMNRFVTNGLAFIAHEIDQQMSQSRVFPGDVLLNITGASIGRACLAPEKLCPANVNQHVSIIRLTDAILPAFLTYYLTSHSLQKHIASLQAGATRQALTKALIEEFPVPLPPFTEQQHIVDILDERLAAVEHARKAALAQLAAAQALPAAYLREIFENKTVKKWPNQRLADIVDLLPAKSVANNGDDEVKVITTACLTERGFDPRGIKLARMHSKDIADCTVTQGEVLIARSNTSALVGRVSAYDYEASDIVASDLTIRLRPKENLLATFLSAHLSYLYLTGYWRERAGGASDSMKKITRRQIIEVNVPVPPLETQNMVVNQLKEKFGGIEQLMSTLSHQSNALAAIPAALLRQAFNGEL